jgi:hypothetical protein
MTSLKVKWNLKLNKRKSEILTAEKIEEINGVKCSTSVKYLGVRVAVDKKDQIRISKEQINKNVQLLRWKLKRVDGDVLERLTCCLARSMLIYIETPMAAAGLWKRQDKLNDLRLIYIGKNWANLIPSPTKLSLTLQLL